MYARSCQAQVLVYCIGRQALAALSQLSARSMQVIIQAAGLNDFRVSKPPPDIQDWSSVYINFLNKVSVCRVALLQW